MRQPSSSYCRSDCGRKAHMDTLQAQCNFKENLKKGEILSNLGMNCWQRGRQESQGNEEIRGRPADRMQMHQSFRSNAKLKDCREINLIISDTWTSHPNYIRFLKLFSGDQGTRGSFTSSHNRGSLGRCCLKDPRKTPPSPNPSQPNSHCWQQ